MYDYNLDDYVYRIYSSLDYSDQTTDPPTINQSDMSYFGYLSPSPVGDGGSGEYDTNLVVPSANDWEVDYVEFQAIDVPIFGRWRREWLKSWY